MDKEEVGNQGRKRGSRELAMCFCSSLLFCMSANEYLRGSGDGKHSKHSRMGLGMPGMSVPLAGDKRTDPIL